MSDAGGPVLVTGGAGFVGSHIVDALLERDEAARVTVIDRLSHGGSRSNLSRHEGDARLRFVQADVNDGEVVERLVAEAGAVIHAAAESHVDRSIAGPREFVRSNVLGTQTVLDAVRRHRRRMLMISTDEVYGPNAPDGDLFAEDAPLAPKSPYSASKAGADLLAQAYVATYDAPISLVRGTNAYGPRQIERVVPTYTIRALEGSTLPVYGEGKQRREFLHVRDWARAALVVLDRGAPGVVYNIGRGDELANIDLAKRICALVGVDESMIEFVQDRPGHDFRYGVRSGRLDDLGWSPEIGFEEGLASTVGWYREHRERLRAEHGDLLTS